MRWENLSQNSDASCETTAKFTRQSSEEPYVVNGESVIPRQCCLHYRRNWLEVGQCEFFYFIFLLFFIKPSYAHRICRVMYFIQTKLLSGASQLLILPKLLRISSFPGFFQPQVPVTVLWLQLLQHLLAAGGLGRRAVRSHSPRGLPSKHTWRLILVLQSCSLQSISDWQELHRQGQLSGCQMCTLDPSHIKLRRLFQPSIIKAFKNKLWL